MNLNFQNKLRERELSFVVSEIPKGCNILEIGAGTGWQAKLLYERGYSVQAIDIKDSNYSGNRVWPVLIYDGKRIPFSDNSFDVIFSSCVLEHIPHIWEFQKEILRVLRRGGVAIHILPSSLWRIWTTTTYYPYALKEFFSRLVHPVFKLYHEGDDLQYSIADTCIDDCGLFDLVRINILPSRHGEFGNFMSEIYYFSRFYWNNLFLRTNWQIIKRTHNHLFYTGHLLFGDRLSLPIRTSLSTILGSACHIYIIRPISYSK